MNSNVNYGFANSKELLAKLNREQIRLRNAINGQDTAGIADAIFNFAVTGYHIKDWLNREGVRDVEVYINNNLELRVCADLCNGSKHRLLSNPREKSDPVNEIRKSPITADMASITCDLDIPINANTVRIMLSSGNFIEVLDFTKKVIDLWNQFFNSHHI